MVRVPYVFCDHVATNVLDVHFVESLSGLWGAAASEVVRREGDCEDVTFGYKVTIYYRNRKLDEIDSTVPVSLDRLISEHLPAIRPYIAFLSLFYFNVGKCPHVQAVNALLNCFTTTFHFDYLNMDHYGVESEKLVAKHVSVGGLFYIVLQGAWPREIVDAVLDTVPRMKLDHLEITTPVVQFDKALL
uniref:AsnC_trans_reg domain-containing protein n=1 Tax=Steinernema glaseri TaxID=37863 RepID=A0A1I7XWJ1_9BILA